MQWLNRELATSNINVSDRESSGNCIIRGFITPRQKKKEFLFLEILERLNFFNVQPSVLFDSSIRVFSLVSGL